MLSKAIPLLLLLIYCVVTIAVFNLVYKTTQLVVDEEFHLRQGEHYCNGRFQIWDPKITTFPGLYIVSALVLYPLQACSVYNLRLTSLVASVINVVLMYKIRQTALGTRKSASLLLETTSLALLPPLYFFSHLYYTDVLSVMTVLLMILASERRRHNWAALFALCAVVVRQTNIVWVGFVCGSRILDLVLRKRSLWETVLSIRILWNVCGEIIKKFLGYLVVVASFLLFLLVNGSIVVGDKSAHEAAIHLPQLFYFAIFFAFFSTSLVIPSLKTLRRTLAKRRYQWMMAMVFVAMLLVIRYNTIVHPYMLADNRHYTFYLWNRFFGRWWFVRYLAVPLYAFALLLLTGSAFRRQTIGFNLLFAAATLASVALQQLIEIRYFLLPFLILRLLRKSGTAPSMKALVTEVLINVVINVVTFYLFVSKEIRWENYSETQRLMW